jgi:hypothetical protein
MNKHQHRKITIFYSSKYRKVAQEMQKKLEDYELGNSESLQPMR